MTRHPIEYTKETLIELKDKLVKIEVGDHYSTESTEVIIGKFGVFTLASNPPNLPVRAQFFTENGDEKCFDFFQLKKIEILNS